MSNTRHPLDSVMGIVLSYKRTLPGPENCLVREESYIQLFIPFCLFVYQLIQQIFQIADSGYSLENNILTGVNVLVRKMDTNKQIYNTTFNKVINKKKKVICISDEYIITNYHKGYEENRWDAVIKHKGRRLILANYSNHLVETANVSFSLQARSCPRQHLNPRQQCSDISVSKPVARAVRPAPCPCPASPINLGTVPRHLHSWGPGLCIRVGKQDKTTLGNVMFLI